LRWRSTASGRPVGQSRCRTRRRRPAALRWRKRSGGAAATLSAKNRGGRHQRHQQGVESEPGRRPVLRHIGVRQRHREEDDLGDQPDRTADHQSQPQRADALKRASRREEFDHRTFEPFEPFEQLSSLRWWHPRDLLVAEFEPGRPLNLHTRTLVSLDGPDRRSRRCPIQRRQSIRFTCPSPGDRAESVLGVRPACETDLGSGLSWSVWWCSRAVTARAAMPTATAAYSRADCMLSVNAAWAWPVMVGSNWEARARKDRACSASGSGSAVGCSWWR